MTELSSFALRLDMPMFVADGEGQIIYKNDAARADSALNMRRSLVHTLDKSVYRQYLDIRSSGSGVISFYLRASRYTAIVRAGKSGSIWYFPRALKKNMYLSDASVSQSYLTDEFFRIEEAMINRTLAPSSIYWSVASSLGTAYIASGKMMLGDLVECSRIMSRLLFGDDLIKASGIKDDLLALSDPALAYNSSQEAINRIRCRTTSGAAFETDGERLFIRVAGASLPCGEVLSPSGVRAIDPFFFSKTSSALALAAACALEFAFRKNT